MPTYVYLCKCGAEFDEHQSLSHESTAECPYCTKITTQRVPQRLSYIVTRNGFEKNTDKAKSQDTLHHARLENKRLQEEEWDQKASEGWEYDPGKSPEDYQPKQHVNRTKLY